MPDELELKNLRAAVISAAGCIVDLYQVVSALSAEMPTLGGPSEKISAPMKSLEGRIMVMLERLDGSDGAKNGG